MECAHGVQVRFLTLVPVSMRGWALRPLLALISLAIDVQGEIYPLQVISQVGAGAFCTAQEEVDAIAPLVQFPLHHHKACACISANMFGAEGGSSQLQVMGIRNAHNDALKKVYQHPLIMSATEIRRGLVSAGEASRIRRFVDKLLTGKPVTVVTLGGSISAGHGTFVEEDAWPNRVYAWIRATFPHPGHRLVNAAIPATTSAFIEPCVNTLLPPDPDLIFIEYTVNDSAEDQRGTNNGQLDTPARRTVERLIRELMSLPSRPAIAAMHAWSPFVTYATAQNPYGGSEDLLSSVYKHYQATIFSFRDLMVPILRQHPNLITHLWGKNDIHPTCIGTRYIADMIIGRFMDQLGQASLRQHIRMIEHNSMPNLPLLNEELDMPLPLPLFEGNAVTFTTQCVMDTSLAGHLLNSSGFTWVNEGTASSPKWGYVSSTPKSHLTFKMPLSGIQYNQSTNEIVVGVGILLSWNKEMGVGTITCQGGCQCEPKDFSTYLAYAGWSMTFWNFVPAKVVPGGTECLVTVVNAEETYSMGHRLKLSHLLVSGNLLTMGAQVAWMEQGIIKASVGHRVHG